MQDIAEFLYQKQIKSKEYVIFEIYDILLKENLCKINNSNNCMVLLLEEQKSVIDFPTIMRATLIKVSKSWTGNQIYL